MNDLLCRGEANPCLGCGACCAFYRCSFYWQEADDATPGGVPVEFTEDLSDFRRAMKGTNEKEPRCVALAGAIGTDAYCAIYTRRSTTCRAFLPSYFNGVPELECDKARLRHGLAPLKPDQWKPEEDGNGRPTRPRRPRRAA